MFEITDEPDEPSLKSIDNWGAILSDLYKADFIIKMEPTSYYDESSWFSENTIHTMAGVLKKGELQVFISKNRGPISLEVKKNLNFSYGKFGTQLGLITKND